MFEETHETGYLDKAIGLAEELVLSDNGTPGLLNTLLELRGVQNTPIPGLECHVAGG